MDKDIISFTKQLISIPSISGNFRALDEILEMVLKELSDFTVERFEHEGVKSALVYVGKYRPKKFKILLNGHLDVIPGKDSQYVARQDGDKLYGVGSMDMKANVACIVHIFREVAHKVDYPIGLQLVTDEEVGGFHGTKYQIEQGVRTDFIIAAEPTNFDIVIKAKGILWLEVAAKGKTAHGAYPWNGENAIQKMAKFIVSLEKKGLIPTWQKWATTVNVSKIEAPNDALNKVPDICKVVLDIRYIPEESGSIIKTIRKLLPKNFSMKILAKEPSMLVSEKNAYVESLARIAKKITGKKTTLRGANGSSDARHFTAIKAGGIEFGPIGGGIGSDDEWVSLSSLEKYVSILKHFLLEL